MRLRLVRSRRRHRPITSPEEQEEGSQDEHEVPAASSTSRISTTSSTASSEEPARASSSPSAATPSATPRAALAWPLLLLALLSLGANTNAMPRSATAPLELLEPSAISTPVGVFQAETEVAREASARATSYLNYIPPSISSSDTSDDESSLLDDVFGRLRNGEDFAHTGQRRRRQRRLRRRKARRSTGAATGSRARSRSARTARNIDHCAADESGLKTRVCQNCAKITRTRNAYATCCFNVNNAYGWCKRIYDFTNPLG